MLLSAMLGPGTTLGAACVAEPMLGGYRRAMQRTEIGDGVALAMAEAGSGVASHLEHLQVAGAGHDPAEQRPTEVNDALVDFLRGIEALSGRVCSIRKFPDVN